MTESKTDGQRTDIFDRHSFEQALYHIPDDVIFEMAKDGVICSAEVLRIAQLMGLSHERIQALRQHHQLVAGLILRYATRYMHLPVNKQLCRLTGRQAVTIMQSLLDKGLIEKYYHKVLDVAKPADTPNMPLPSQEKER